MLPMTFEEISAALGGSYSENARFTGVCTDSRKITPGCLFVAIEGERFDAHSFVPDAFRQGAAGALCHKKVDCAGPVMLVENTRCALLSLAGYYRRKLGIKVVGVTGSVGKTTTKEMAFAALSTQLRTEKTGGNLNNEIGLPLTLLGIPEGTQAAVIEMGMSNFGEISALTAAAAPDIGIITKIGVSHMENLGSRENILKAKLEILEGMPQGAPLILNGDDDLLCNVKPENNPVFFFGIDNKLCDCIAENIVSENNSTRFNAKINGESLEVEIPTIGKHNIYNALAGLSSAYNMGLNLQQAARGLADYETAGMRQRIRTVAGITVIEDCYNSSPDSVKAAVSALMSVGAEYRAFVFGDMLELGELSQSAHREMGRLIAQSGVDALLTYGELSEETALAAKAAKIPLCRSFKDKAELASFLSGIMKPGAAVVFKGSRGMKLEDALHTFYEIIGE